ncbi:hypothetical protein ACLKA6_018711 [Drosophila palustris]
MRAPTSTAGYAGNLRILVGHGADHEYHEGNAVTEGENAGITVRTVGIATVGRYCWNQGNLRILVGHGADHEYHEGNAVTEGENAGITVRTVGIATDGRYCGNQGNLRILVGHGADHEYHEGNAVTERGNAGITGKGNDEHQGARKPPKAHCGHGVNRGDNNGTWLLTVMLCADFRTRSDDADRGTYGRKKATKDVRNTGNTTETSHGNKSAFHCGHDPVTTTVQTVTAVAG